MVPAPSSAQVNAEPFRQAWMQTRFHNRSEAGRLLASKLQHYAGHHQIVVLALPRGGVPVAYEVARALGAPLDVFLVRKLGVPGHEELAMGAIATGDVRVLNVRLVHELQIPDQAVEEVTARERRELLRREQAYRGNRLPPDISGKTIILIDDGIATGSTMRAAIAALQKQHPAKLVVAVPAAALSTYEEVRSEVDDIVAVMTPEPFHGVGQWYTDFTQTTDEEVRELLARAAQEQSAGRQDR